MLAHCRLLNDDVYQAAINLEKARELDPNSSIIHWNMIRLLVKRKDFKIALEMAWEGNKKFPNETEGMAILASCLRLNGYIEESLSILDKVL